MGEHEKQTSWAALKTAFAVDKDHPDEPVAVVFAANDYYAPYLSALIASLLAHRSSERRYDLIVLSADFSERNQRIFHEAFAADDVSLRFLDVTEAMRPYGERLPVRGHFKLETYFRLLLPQLLPDYAKILYLDADMICLADVAELFDTDVEGYLVAACKDADTAGIYNGVDRDLGQPDKKGYMDDVLGIEQPFEYFQAGTIVFNLDEWRRSIDVEEVFRFAQRERWQLLDQDVLNYFCQGRCAFLDMAWNVMFDLEGFRVREIIARAPRELREAHLAAREHPKIVHYAGNIKPWDDPTCDFAECFWHYARQAPLYEVALGRMQAAATDRTLGTEVRDARKVAQAALSEGELALSMADDALVRLERVEARFERLPTVRAWRFAQRHIIRPLERVLREIHGA